jgi:WhiB family redox-sensing transcriptional regulator
VALQTTSVEPTRNDPVARADWLAARTFTGDPADLLAELSHLLADAPSWHADAACRETPGVNFFPDKGAAGEPAKAVCGRCLVRADCLAWALEQLDLLAGIWAGTSGRDRRLLRARRAAA